jgi:hypothetical protein
MGCHNGLLSTDRPTVQTAPRHTDILDMRKLSYLLCGGCHNGGNSPSHAHHIVLAQWKTALGDIHSA